jgi:hypothetical protein
MEPETLSCERRGDITTMKVFGKLPLLFLFLAAMALVASADNPGRHPYYLHALSDLRDARAHLDKIGADDRIDNEEQHAIEEIDHAIDEIKRASIDDGKDIHDHVRVDLHMPRRGRVRKALELLDKAHHDVAQEEDDPNTRGLQERALRHIDEAHHTVEHIVHSWD